jgi:hypothetical protein
MMSPGMSQQRRERVQFNPTQHAAFSDGSSDSKLDDPQPRHSQQGTAKSFQVKLNHPKGSGSLEASLFEDSPFEDSSWGKRKQSLSSSDSPTHIKRTPSTPDATTLSQSTFEELIEIWTKMSADTVEDAEEELRTISAIYGYQIKETSTIRSSTEESNGNKYSAVTSEIKGHIEVRDIDKHDSDDYEHEELALAGTHHTPEMAKRVKSPLTSVWLRCTREGMKLAKKELADPSKRRNSSSDRCNCPFKVHVWIEEGQVLIKVSDVSHNHKPMTKNLVVKATMGLLDIAAKEELQEMHRIGADYEQLEQAALRSLRNRFPGRIINVSHVIRGKNF